LQARSRETLFLCCCPGLVECMCRVITVSLSTHRNAQHDKRTIKEMFSKIQTSTSLSQVLQILIFHFPLFKTGCGKIPYYKFQIWFYVRRNILRTPIRLKNSVRIATLFYALLLSLCTFSVYTVRLFDTFLRTVFFWRVSPILSLFLQAPVGQTVKIIVHTWPAVLLMRIYWQFFTINLVPKYSLTCLNKLTTWLRRIYQNGFLSPPSLFTLVLQGQLIMKSGSQALLLWQHLSFYS